MNASNIESKRIQYYQDIESAAARAISQTPQLHQRGSWFFKGDEPISLYAAHLTEQEYANPQAQITHLRARADAAALRLLHCDEALHQQSCPTDEIERMIFELLEQLRCESLATLNGMQHNLQESFKQWSQQFAQSEAAQSLLGLLLLTTSQIIYSRLNACEISDHINDLIESTRANIVPTIGYELNQIRRHRHHQAEYIPAALSIARTIGSSIRHQQEQQANQTNNQKTSPSSFKLPLNFTPPPPTSFPIAQSGIKTADYLSGQYRIWSTQYDKESRAEKLVRHALLNEYREELERNINQSKLNLNRLARIYRQLITHEHISGWNFDQESGYIDPRRLSHIISRPTETRIFKTLATPPQADCQATLLIDCSGSMKNAVAQFAPFADIFCRIFEMAGARSEVLGFSTQAWNGGRAMRDWNRAGRPEQPGRLNETHHLIFKSANQAHKRAKLSICALYKADLFREGIDGEALEWAISRLYQQTAKRRLLFVLSDGCPMDRATELANPDNPLLERHLRQVVEQHDRHGIEIYGLGLGLDLSLFYRHRLALDSEKLLTQQTFIDIAQLISQRQKQYG